MKFISGEFYQVYNRGNNQQKIFYTRDNYLYFLKKIRKELSPFCNILAYCLMPNHYHLLIHVKDHEQRDNLKMHPLSKKIGTIQSSYTQWHNKTFRKKGSLFQQKSKSRLLDSPDHRFVCFHYIHQNPLKAKLCDSMERWEFSSFVDYTGLRKGTLPAFEIAYEYLEISKELEKFYKQSLTVIPDDAHKNIY
ncbi:MAG: transposase [Candidatus Cyclobacteriaceae bacterium M2_1C_046]